MATNRKIRKVFKSKPTLEGAGVHLRRVFGNSEVPLFDPFLMLDDFRNTDPSQYIKGFPWHPHRGIETITYVLKGDVEHGDSIGNKGIITSGDMQWMTAGAASSIRRCRRGQRRSHGGISALGQSSQIPQDDDPRYRDIKSSQVPEIVTQSGAKIKVICGTMVGKQGPVRDIVINPEYLDVALPALSEFVHKVPHGRTVFAYVIGGKGIFCNEKNPYAYGAEGVNYFDMERDLYIHNGTAVLFGDGDQVTVSAQSEPVRFLLISGKPIGEPVAWYGPIVMNTEEELKIAFEEYRNGTFIK
jgi:redox-sensitive bicupin YhaK (pirin superfamily)